MRKKIGKIFVAMGGLLIAASLVLLIYNFYDSYRAQKAAAEITGQLEDQIDASNQVGDDSDDEFAYASRQEMLCDQLKDMEMPVQTINENNYIGILEIPSISLELPIMENWSYAGLRIAPGRYAGTVYKRNIVIAGHNYSTHFSPIKKLQPGDWVYFTDVSGNRFTYQVGWTEIIKPTDVKGMTGEEDGNEWDLTLFTCTYDGGSRHTVRCVLTEE